MLNIRSGLKNKILNYFFLNTNSRVYINELARQLEADPKNVYRNLCQLEQGGLLASEFKGKERYFFLNKQNPLTKSYRDIFLKTSGLEEVLKKVFQGVVGIAQAYIYGSYARDRIGVQSDIDILLVGDHDPLQAQTAVYNIQKSSGRDIHISNVKTAEFDKRRTQDQFLKTVFGGKVIKLI